MFFNRPEEIEKTLDLTMNTQDQGTYNMIVDQEVYSIFVFLRFYSPIQRESHKVTKGSCLYCHVFRVCQRIPLTHLQKAHFVAV